MPRGSRHKSHKQHKHSLKDLKEGSLSEGEEMHLKQQRAESAIELPRKVRDVSQVVRVSKDSESNDAGKGKVKSVSQQGKDLLGPGNDDFSNPFFVSKQRKERVDSVKERVDSVVTDRWNGGEGLVGYASDSQENESKPDGKEEKESKPKVSVSIDSKSKSSRRHENSEEVGSEWVYKVKEEVIGVAGENQQLKRSSGKIEQRQRLEKELDRKDVHQYKDGKEKERGGVEKDKKIDVKWEKSVDLVAGVAVVAGEVSRKQTVQDDRMPKREGEITEWQLQDDLRNPELEKELEKRIRRRSDGSGDKDKRQDDTRDGDDRVKNGRYKDERHKDSRYKDKYRGDLDRDHRYRDDKHREEWSSRDRDRSDNKQLRDEYRSSESRHKKTKLLDSDRDCSPHIDGRNIRLKDSRGRKRSSDDNGDIKSRGSKEPRADVAKNKIDGALHKGISESPDLHMDLVDDATGNNQQKRSPSWHSSKQAESAYKSPLSEEKLQQVTGSTSSREQATGFEVSEKVTESRLLDKPKHKRDHLDELSTANVAASHYERSPTSVGQTSPAQLTEKSPSPATRDHRNSSKIMRMQSHDAEEISWRSSSSKDGRDINPNEDRERVSHPEKPVGDGFSQPEAQKADLAPSSSSFDRTGNLFSGSSSNLLPPPPPFRLGTDSPSVMGSSDDDLRVQTGDRKFNNRYKRSNDLMGRGQGNSWKGIPNWPLPVTNGFIPFQPGPAAAGFHAVMPQFPAPPLFGVRPSMELNPGSIPYHMHEGDRFSSHGHPFGWRGPADDPCQPHVQAHLHGWESSGGAFGDEPHIYGRSDWDQNRQLMGSRGWDRNPDLWKSQNGGTNMEFPASQKEPDYPPHVHPDEVLSGGQPGHRSRHERNRLERFPAEGIEIKRSEDAPSPKTKVEAPQRNVQQKAPGHAKISNATSACFYLSKLDISVDLSGPELYKQCTSMSGLEGRTTVAGRESLERMSLESWSEDTRALAGSSKHGSRASSFFPKVTSAIFERAMSLYEQQKQEMEAMIHALKKPEKASPALEAEKATLQAIGSPSGNESATSSRDCSGDAVEQSDIGPSAVILADGSVDACEALKPESIGCRVNLNRIHSPESTH